MLPIFRLIIKLYEMVISYPSKVLTIMYKYFQKNDKYEGINFLLSN